MNDILFCLLAVAFIAIMMFLAYCQGYKSANNEHDRDGFLEVIEQEHEAPTILLHIDQDTYDKLPLKQYIILSVVKKKL